MNSLIPGLCDDISLEIFKLLPLTVKYELSFVTKSWNKELTKSYTKQLNNFSQYLINYYAICDPKYINIILMQTVINNQIIKIINKLLKDKKFGSMMFFTPNISIQDQNK